MVIKNNAESLSVHYGTRQFLQQVLQKSARFLKAEVVLTEQLGCQSFIHNDARFSIKQS